MNPLSALGPDGFTGKFFRHCWYVVGFDVVAAVQEFLRQVLFMLVLIPILLFLFLW